MFLEILAITRRARLERLRLDSRPFRNAIDEAAPTWTLPAGPRGD
jgi:hypothetical protein